MAAEVVEVVVVAVVVVQATAEVIAKAVVEHFTNTHSMEKYKK